MTNARFDVTHYEIFNVFRDNLIAACKLGCVEQLDLCLQYPQATQFLWMREAPALFGSNLSKEIIFNGFEFYETHSVPLILEALNISVAARSEDVFGVLWHLSGNYRRGQVDFLVHYFKNEEMEYVSPQEKDIVVKAMNTLKSFEREQLFASNITHKPLFVELWAQSQNHLLQNNVQEGCDNRARKL